MKRIFLILCLAFTAAAAADPVDAGGARDNVLQALLGLEQQSDDPDVAYAIGAIYFNKLHNDEESARWLRKAADKGLSEAQFALGVMYGLGKGVPHDEAEGLRLVRLAAAQGHADALEAIDRLNREDVWTTISFCRHRLQIITNNFLR